MNNLKFSLKMSYIWECWENKQAGNKFKDGEQQ